MISRWNLRFSGTRKIKILKFTSWSKSADSLVEVSCDRVCVFDSQSQISTLILSYSCRARYLVTNSVSPPSIDCNFLQFPMFRALYFLTEEDGTHKVGHAKEYRTSTEGNEIIDRLGRIVSERRRWNANTHSLPAVQRVGYRWRHKFPFAADGWLRW